MKWLSSDFSKNLKYEVISILFFTITFKFIAHDLSVGLVTVRIFKKKKLSLSWEIS